MAKIKNKKRKISDDVHSKKEANVKKLNPFEVHINKEKMAVLGRKLKNDRGLPGVSRTKAMKKRKETLLQEYKLQNNSNKFLDKRIGEKSRNLTEEDKLMARFTAIRKKAHKKSIFNLADDEVLTHKGQTLSEIEKFDDPRSDDEWDDLDGKKSGNLESSFVGDAHFGGGLLKKTGHEGAKTHKELIDQLISESKKRKAEKQKLKEATLDLTEKLDTEWKDLLPLVSKSKKQQDEVIEKQKVDDYDKVMRQLKFEARGTVSDRLKTEDEINKEEKEKLDKLEYERIERMKADIDSMDSKRNHRSADDLDDDYFYDSDPEQLSYNLEGQANVPVDAQLNGKKLYSSDNQKIGDEDGSEDEVDEDDSEQGSEESDSEDNLSDLKAEESAESDIEEEPCKEKGQDQKEAEQEVQELGLKSEHTLAKPMELKNDLLEKARQELPNSIPFPDSYEAFQTLFKNKSSYHQNVIIEKIIQSNHPSLAEANKEKLGILFAYLLQHLNDCASGASDEMEILTCFDIYTNLVPRIQQLAQLNPENAHNSIKEVIKEKYEEFKKKKQNYPGLEVLIFLKLVGLLFTTSDFRHQVVSPCFIFIEQMLNKCKVKTRRDIAYGIFLTTLVLEVLSF